jgi:hypothetical protein
MRERSHTPAGRLVLWINSAIIPESSRLYGKGSGFRFDQQRCPFLEAMGRS